MARVSTLKDRARSFEQGEQWKHALDTYRQLVEESDSDDSGLWNRIGDLHMRLGQDEQAVAAYEHAVEKYIDTGLFNNAIALCNKILRAAPDRTPTYLKLGQISAAQGFLADARRNFLQYAERMQKAGDLDASFNSLKEFADLSPNDGEVRRLLADQLLAHGRGDEAIEQLGILVQQHEVRGQSAEADAVRREILDIDPDADLDSLVDGISGAAHRMGAGTTAERGFDVLPTFETASSTPTPAPSTEEESELHIDATIPDAVSPTDDVSNLEGLEPTLNDAEGTSLADIQVGDDDATAEDLFVRELEAAADADPQSGIEVPDLDLGVTPAAESAPELAAAEPDLDVEPTAESSPDFELSDAGTLEGFDATVQESKDGAGADGADLPFLDALNELDVPANAEGAAGALDEAAEALLADVDEPGADDGESSLPLLATDEWADESSAAVAGTGMGGEDSEWDFEIESSAAEAPVEGPPASGDRLDLLRSRHEADPGDAAVRGELIATLRERDAEEEIPGLLERGHRELAAADRYAEAAELVRELIPLRRDDTALYQKQVEYAFRAGDRDRLIQAYLDLGRHLETGENPSRAGAVYQRVLELDPNNADARRAVAAASTYDASTGARTVGDDGYVDLAALIFDDESEDRSTRFVVPEDEPTGDEDRDFADMLSRFRQKVSENISIEDSTSHYDLGLAFKDMGLLDEAISQFQVALRGGANPLATLEVLGECFVGKGQFSLASRVLDRALRLPDVDEQSLVGVYYWLGRCDEVLGRPQNARDNYERVLSLDLRFRDTASRLEGLRDEA